MLEINDENRALIDTKLEVANEAYKAYNEQSQVVRQAQNKLREHNGTIGRDNKEYDDLAEELSAATQDFQDKKLTYDISKADWEDTKRNFGKKTTF